MFSELNNARICLFYRLIMQGFRNIILVGVCMCCMLSGSAQINAPAIRMDSTFKNCLNFGPSFGVMLDRNAQYWGLSLGYSRLIKSKWALTPAVAYDQEFDYTTTEGGIINTFTFMATATYFLNQYWSVTSGLAKGIVDDDNSTKSLLWVNGDISTGLSIGRSIPNFAFWSRDSFAVSSAIEYNFSKQEFSFSIDLVAGLSW